LEFVITPRQLFDEPRLVGELFRQFVGNTHLTPP
jgi:hypothetical protein